MGTELQFEMTKKLRRQTVAMAAEQRECGSVARTPKTTCMFRFVSLTTVREKLGWTSSYHCEDPSVDMMRTEAMAHSRLSSKGSIQWGAC